MHCVDEFRDPRVWHQNNKGDWRLRCSVVDNMEDEIVKSVTQPLEETAFEWVVTPSKRPEANESTYTLMHRGWVDQYS